MARKRMFDSEIINQDSFLDLPMEAKALYFLLGMEADDEGFVSYRKVLRLYGGTEDSIKILAAKNYIIPFKSGVIVITDWKRNNYLDKNRLKETIYQDEKKLLIFNEKTEQYELNQKLIEASDSQCLTNVKQMLNQSSIEENRVEEISIEESSSSENNNLYDLNVAKIDKLMVECLNTTNTNNIMECIGYLDKLPIELIEYVLRKTARIQHPSWQYAMSILDDYVRKGFKTMEQVKGDELSYKSRKQPKEETEEEKKARKIKELEESLNGNI